MSERAFYDHLGRCIRVARQRIGWSQLRLAMELGFTAGVTVHYWEVALNRPRAFELHRMDALFGQGWR